MHFLARALRALVGERGVAAARQGLASMAWACAAASQADELLRVAMASKVQQRAGGLEPQELANTGWAFAKITRTDAPLFTAFGCLPELGLLAINGAQDLVNTAWMFTTVGRWNVPLLLAVAKATERVVNDF
eukprot:gnl/TRDRNA2_/TRDRNA2_175773_c24_seq3.p1 gnl/TRDRNA2_/TRDRNA2_175773_c24~~gnl/TRDRNA2_/TRDRNA2_175773_c24_seq3.p1  ORF type:complete len:132 (+),score=18.23 gnl/TRDRNA2_/TRDRNA2_175773_c24_seq3:120-515(+)